MTAVHVFLIFLRGVKAVYVADIEAADRAMQQLLLEEESEKAAAASPEQKRGKKTKNTGDKGKGKEHMNARAGTGDAVEGAEAGCEWRLAEVGSKSECIKGEASVGEEDMRKTIASLEAGSVHTSPAAGARVCQGELAACKQVGEVFGDDEKDGHGGGDKEKKGKKEGKKKKKVKKLDGDGMDERIIEQDDTLLRMKGAERISEGMGERTAASLEDVHTSPAGARMCEDEVVACCEGHAEVAGDAETALPAIIDLLTKAKKKEKRKKKKAASAPAIDHADPQAAAQDHAAPQAAARDHAAPQAAAQDHAASQAAAQDHAAPQAAAQDHAAPQAAAQGHAAPSQAASNDECSVCLNGPPTMVLIPCAHLCLCEGCSIDLAQPGKLCPICRVACTGSLRVFRA